MVLFTLHFAIGVKFVTFEKSNCTDMDIDSVKYFAVTYQRE